MTYWLEGGVIALHDGADNGFLQEVDRVVELLGADEQRLAWWGDHSKAPRLEMQPAPLGEGVLRRRRLQELLDARSGRMDERS